MGGAGIPGFWVDGAGGGGFDAACRKALAACGLDPDAFGNYTQRLNAAAAARDEYRAHMGPDREKHDPSCNYRKKGGNLGRCECHELPAAQAFFKDKDNSFLLANSQAGHEGQNAFSQSKRGDPCSNVPPPSGNPNGAQDGGSYGYDDTKAGCTDHYGKSTDPGTTHYEVTRAEAAYTQTIATTPPGSNRVGGDAIQQGVEQTARIAANGPDASKYQGPDDKEGRDRAADFTKAQSDQAAALSAREGTKPNSECSAEEQKKNKDKAVECMVAHWKMMIDKMRMDAIDQHSTAANSPRCAEAVAAQNAKNAAARQANGTDEPADIKRFSQLSTDDQKQVVQDTQAAADARNAELADSVAKGKKGPGNDNPSMDDCREYQANWLATAGWGPNGSGSLPGLSGRKPGPASDATGGSGSSGRGTA